MANEKLQGKIKDLLIEKGYFTAVEDVIKIPCTKIDYENRFYREPPFDPQGECLYEKRTKRKVIDELTEAEIDRIIKLELIEKLAQNDDKLAAISETGKAVVNTSIESDVESIKLMVKFFVILAAIGLIAGIIILLI